MFLYYTSHLLLYYTSHLLLYYTSHLLSRVTPKPKALTTRSVLFLCFWVVLGEKTL